ncbi:MAG: hypothetical protein L0Z55_00905 [Planctomycetes bacterium]|nr:hypothetical protein [Planctomycetota bacterium]
MTSVVLAPAPAAADNHITHIEEVFSNADGTLQWVEIQADGPFQTNFSVTKVFSYNADGSVETEVFDFAVDFPGLGSGESILLATAGFEAEYGFAPDVVIDDNSLTLGSGRVAFKHDMPCGVIVDCEIDAVAYGDFTGDNGVYGDPAAELPSDGCSALVRTGSGASSALNFDVEIATPENLDGDTVTVECEEPPPPPGNQFVRGDANGDGIVALPDVLQALSYLFLNGTAPCIDAIDFDNDGAAGLLDIIGVLGYQFLQGAPPAPPFPDCGEDDDGALGCVTQAVFCTP